MVTYRLKTILIFALEFIHSNINLITPFITVHSCETQVEKTAFVHVSQFPLMVQVFTVRTLLTTHHILHISISIPLSLQEKESIWPKLTPGPNRWMCVLNIPEVYCSYKPPPGFCARWSLKTWILSETCKHCLWSDTNYSVWLSDFKWRKNIKHRKSSVGGVKRTFVWVIELENVGSGGVIRQHHHPSSHTHLLTGAGLILWQT